MKRILIFSGTTEGRTLSEKLVSMGISHTVSVASEYGELMMHESPLVSIMHGRMDETQMESFISNHIDLVFDATHPFAEIVSENIRKACDAVGAVYIRVVRDYDSLVDSNKSKTESNENVVFFNNISECIHELLKTDGNILLTTGSKSLKEFTSCDELKHRIFARVLPSAESIKLCNDAGLFGKSIIAMHGPFSEEINRAIINQYDIGILVTKETGNAGGFPEKISAANKEGIRAFVIGRPKEKEGISLDEAIELCENTLFDSATEFNALYLENESPANERELVTLDISLIGIGPGAKEYLTIKAAKLIDDADLIFGAPRMISGYENKKCYPYYLAKDVLPILKKTIKGTIESTGKGKKAHQKRIGVAILFSGDSGFYSGAKKMKVGLEEGLLDLASDGSVLYRIDMIPGISSLSYFASRLGIDYSDSNLMSLHGKDSVNDELKSLINEVNKSGSVFTLLSGKGDIEKILDAAGKGYRIIVGYNLSYDNEMIVDVTSCEPKEVSKLADGSYVAYIDKL